MARKGARNKVDGIWVLKWKKVRNEINGKLSWARIVKARLTARGFKAMQAFSYQYLQRDSHQVGTTGHQWTCCPNGLHTVLNGHKRRLLERNGV